MLKISCKCAHPSSSAPDTEMSFDAELDDNAGVASDADDHFAMDTGKCCQLVVDTYKLCMVIVQGKAHGV